MKAKQLNDSTGQHGGYIVYCPGCRRVHLFDKRWSFNGDIEKPTFTPSMLVEPNRPANRCHSYVTNGNIQFLDDCFHELRGKTIPLEDVPEDW